MQHAARSFAVMLGLMILIAGVARADDKYEEIDHKDLKKAITEKKVVLLDLNGTKVYKANHIPGAIDFKAKNKELKKLLPEDKETLIVAYCGSKMCTAWMAGAEAAKKLGYKNIKHYKPGIKGWLESEKAEGSKGANAGKDKPAEKEGS